MIGKLSNSSLLSKAYSKSMLVGNVAYDPPSFELITTTILSSTSVSTFSFSSIPSGYKHLQIRIDGSSNGVNGYPDYWHLRFNGDTSSIYSTHRLSGTGSTLSDANTYQSMMNALIGMGDNPDAPRTGAAIIDIFDYQSTTKNKSVKALSTAPYQNSSPRVMLSSGLWPSTSAVTSITIMTGYLFGAKTRFSLYGLKG